MKEKVESDKHSKLSSQATRDMTKSNKPSSKTNREANIINSESTDFVWEKYLEVTDLEAVDSSAFRHVQRNAVHYSVGSIVEVVSKEGDAAWPARVTMVCDSLLRLHYIGSRGAACDLWCDPAGDRLRPLGWGWQQGVPLAAPPGVLPADLSAEELSEMLPSSDKERNQSASAATPAGGIDLERITEGMKLEVLDEANPYHVWTATVLERCGDRLRLRRDTLDDTPDLWLCASSAQVRHFGWAARAGDPFVYRPPTESASDRTQAEWEAILEMSRDEARQMAVDDTVLPYTKYEFPMKHSLSVGCRLEAVHPDRSAVCRASVVSVLDSYFFRVQIDDSAISWLSSLEDPTILPYGWCRQQGLDFPCDDLLPSPEEEMDEPAATSPGADGSLAQTQPPAGADRPSDDQQTEGTPGEPGTAGPSRVTEGTPGEPGMDGPSDNRQTEGTLGEPGTDGPSRVTEGTPGEPGMDGPSDSRQTEGTLGEPGTAGQQNTDHPSDGPGIVRPPPSDGQPVGSPFPEQLFDSERAASRCSSADVEALPDSQQTWDEPDSGRTADSPLGSAVSEWLLQDGDEGGLVGGESWLHLSPLSDDLLSSQSPSEVGQHGDFGCIRNGEADSPPLSIGGMELLPAAEEEEEEDMPPPCTAVPPSPSGVQPMEEEMSPPSEARPQEERLSSGGGTQSIGVDVPSPSSGAQAVGDNGSSADVQAEEQTSVKDASSPSTGNRPLLAAGGAEPSGEVASSPVPPPAQRDGRPSPSEAPSSACAGSRQEPTGPDVTGEPAASGGGVTPPPDRYSPTACAAAEDDVPRLLAADLLPPGPADSVGLTAGSALELVHPVAADRLCAAAVQRTAGHLLWIRLLCTAGAPELIYSHTSDCLFPVGWAAANGAPFQPPTDWCRRRPRRRPRRHSSGQARASVAADGAAGGSAAEPDHPGADSAANTWTGPLYVNTACYSGPLLSTNKLVAQPRVVGAGPVRLVARDLLTRLVWAGYHESRVLKHLQYSGPSRPGWTNDLIKAKVNNTIYGGVVELPLCRQQMAEFCAGVFGRLQCCPALVAPARYPADTCPHRCRTTLRLAQQTGRSADLPSAESGPALLRERLGPAKRPRPEYLHALEPPTRRRKGRPPKWLAESVAASSGARAPPPDTGRPALYQVALEKNPRHWDSADLARYLRNTECAHLVPGLLSQELDGISFMLLTCSTLTDVLRMSERDAVALCTHVARVKYTYLTAFSG